MNSLKLKINRQSWRQFGGHTAFDPMTETQKLGNNVKMHTWLQQSIPLQKVPLFLCAPQSGQVVGWEYGKLAASLETVASWSHQYVTT